MREARATAPKPMTVSIVAGPAATRLLGGLASTPRLCLGLLTNAKLDLALKDFQIFHHSPEADPRQIADVIRSIAEQDSTDHLIIHCESDRPAMAYASLFATNDPATTVLNAVARLTTTAFAIESGAFLDAILDRGNGAISAFFLTEQIEFVDRIFFGDAATARDFDLARSIALTLNPRAKVSVLTELRLENLTAGSFDFEMALTSAGWRTLLDDGGPARADLERIISLAYRVWRPFHPSRFWNFLQNNSPELFRAKGFFWLASRMEEVGGLNLAGAELHCASAGTWRAARAEQSRGPEMPERTRRDWKEPFGDRRQAFALFGLDIDPATLQSQLDACLLTDAEMAQSVEAWRCFPDPFANWSSGHVHHHPPKHEHHHKCDGHEHGEAAPDCCHHH